jgi:hypothetical protein
MCFNRYYQPTKWLAWLDVMFVLWLILSDLRRKRLGLAV